MRTALSASGKRPWESRDLRSAICFSRVEGLRFDIWERCVDWRCCFILSRARFLSFLSIVSQYKRRVVMYVALERDCTTFLSWP